MSNNKPPFMGERVRLGDVILPSSQRNKNGECTRVYSVTNSNGFVPSEEYFNKEVYSKELDTYRVVNRGMLAYNPSRINVGSVALQDKEDQVVVSPLYVVFSVDERRIAPEYLLRFLKCDEGLKQIETHSVGTVRNNLKYKGLCNLRINLPSLKAQHSMVRKLRVIETLIDNSQSCISMLDQLVKSQFVEMFGKDRYPILTIGDVSSDIRYGTSKKASEDGRYIYLRMNNLTDDGRLDLSDIKRIDLTESELEKCVVEKGDLLFNRTNSREKVGKTAVFDLDEPMVIAGYIIRVRLQPEVDSIYLSTFMNLAKTKALLQAIAKGAVHQANINARQLAAIEFPLPPLPLQQQFAAFVAEVDKSRFVVQRQIEKLQTLYDSLAQEYFG